MSELVPFAYDGFEIRGFKDGDKPWLVRNDLCAVLDLRNPSQVTADFGPEDLRVIGRSEALQSVDPLLTSLFADARINEIAFVSQEGAIELTLDSKKPGAKAFRYWLTHTVVPQLMKTGTVSLSRDSKSKLLPDKPESVRLRQYVEAAARRTERELAKKGIIGYVNRETGELTILPGTIAADVVKQQVEQWTEQYAHMRQRQAERSGNSPHETPEEMRHNKPWQPEWGQR